MVAPVPEIMDGSVYFAIFVQGKAQILQLSENYTKNSQEAMVTLEVKRLDHMLRDPCQSVGRKQIKEIRNERGNNAGVSKRIRS
jgi:hypothetical protein